MREIRLYGSEGGGAEINRLFLPLPCSCGASGSARRASEGSGRLPLDEGVNRSTIKPGETGSWQSRKRTARTR